MIYVRIELWKGGDPERRELLGEAKIANSGGDASVGHYRAELMKSPKFSRSPGVYRAGAVTNFDRRKGSPWVLVMLAIQAALNSATVSAAGRVLK